MEHFKDLYIKWHKYLNDVVFLVACFVLLLEIIVSFLLYFFFREMILIPVPYYILKYIVLPSSVNFLLAFFGKYIMNSNRFSETIKNYFSILILSSQMFFVVFIHNVFFFIISIFSIPIILTLIYSNKKMTNIITLISIIFMCISSIYSFHISQPKDYIIFVELLIAFVLLIWCNKITHLLMKNEKEKNNILKTSILKQIQLEELIKRDSLTGLFNISSFYKILNSSIESNIRPLSVAVIDIDDFKSVNDTWGHEKGNEVLIYLAVLLEYYCSNVGTVYRYGGEEFSIIFKNKTAEEAKVLIDTVKKSLYDYSFSFMPHQKITFSCGIADYSGESLSAQDFIQKADNYMYQAKSLGKNRIIISD